MQRPVPRDPRPPARRAGSSRPSGSGRRARCCRRSRPCRRSLRTMQHKVTELETQRQQQHGELTQQLRSATESEERLRSTAESLASALRNNATRGVWGETQLRNVVQAAGLIERVDFDVQSSITSDAGARPPRHGRAPAGRQEHRRRRQGAVQLLPRGERHPGHRDRRRGARKREQLHQAARQGRCAPTSTRSSSKAYYDGLDAIARSSSSRSSRASRSSPAPWRPTRRSWTTPSASASPWPPRSPCGRC